MERPFWVSIPVCATMAGTLGPRRGGHSHRTGLVGWSAPRGPLRAGRFRHAAASEHEAQRPDMAVLRKRRSFIAEIAYGSPHHAPSFRST